MQKSKLLRATIIRESNYDEMMTKSKLKKFKEIKRGESDLNDSNENAQSSRR
jgi:hypothetical protein